jgi:hypothetical protein
MRDSSVASQKNDVSTNNSARCRPGRAFSFFGRFLAKENELSIRYTCEADGRFMRFAIEVEGSIERH